MPLFNDEDTKEDELLETPIEPPAEEGPSEDEEDIEVEKNIPSIELIVENGTGVSNANSYCDLDFALEYCVMKGYSDWVDLSEDEQKIFLIRGTEFVDNYFTWKGVRKYKTQVMAFPREHIYDLDHYTVEGIPDRLKKACIEAAWLNCVNGSDTLFSSKDINGQVKRQKVDSLEVEYFENSSEKDTVSSQIDYTTIYDILNKLLKGLYKTQSNTGKVCSRAMYAGW